MTLTQRERLLVILGLLLCGCPAGAPPGPADMTARGDGPSRGPFDFSMGPDMRVTQVRDLTRIVPWRAVDLAGPADLTWQEYDYRPNAQGGSQNEINSTLDHLKAIGARQVLIRATYAWTVEEGGAKTNATVLYDSGYKADDPATWGGLAGARTRRGDMGLVAYFGADTQVPSYWDLPTQLKTPRDLNRQAEQVLSTMLDAVFQKGMTPVLKVQPRLVRTGDQESPDVPFTDPSRSFDQFYLMYREHLLAMTRLAAAHHAALVVLGSGTPYVAGAGTSTFTDGSKMPDMQDAIAGKWHDIIAACRAAATALGHPELLLTYSESGPTIDGVTGAPPPVPHFTRVPFWDDLDAVGINFYLPGRATDAMGIIDMTPQNRESMRKYGESHDFATDGIPNLHDVSYFFVRQRGYSLATRPVLIIEDGCPAAQWGAAGPAGLPDMFMPGPKPDMEAQNEQDSLFGAHIDLGKKYGAGWLAGLGFALASPTSRYGGMASYDRAEAYFNFLGVPTEVTVKAYFNTTN